VLDLWVHGMNTWMSPDNAPTLLVDDNPDVLATTAAFLEQIGFAIMRSSTGEEALRHLGSGRQFALLATDYAIVGTNGVDLAGQALALLPHLKVLIITGFPSGAGLAERPSGVAPLTEPFRRARLIAALRSLFSADETDQLKLFNRRTSPVSEPSPEGRIFTKPDLPLRDYWRLASSDREARTAAVAGNDHGNARIHPGRLPA
jgi:CheY-like chemotaxis protein